MNSPASLQKGGCLVLTGRNYNEPKVLILIRISAGPFGHFVAYSRSMKFFKASRIIIRN